MTHCSPSCSLVLLFLMKLVSVKTCETVNGELNLVCGERMRWLARFSTFADDTCVWWVKLLGLQTQKRYELQEERNKFQNLFADLLEIILFILND